jgi:hypothetical protein
MPAFVKNLTFDCLDALGVAASGPPPSAPTSTRTPEEHLAERALWETTLADGLDDW